MHRDQRLSSEAIICGLALRGESRPNELTKQCATKTASPHSMDTGGPAMISEV